MSAPQILSSRDKPQRLSLSNASVSQSSRRARHNPSFSRTAIVLPPSQNVALYSVTDKSVASAFPYVHADVVRGVIRDDDANATCGVGNTRNGPITSPLPILPPASSLKQTPSFNSTLSSSYDPLAPSFSKGNDCLSHSVMAAHTSPIGVSMPRALFSHYGDSHVSRGKREGHLYNEREQRVTSNIASSERRRAREGMDSLQEHVRRGLVVAHDEERQFTEAQHRLGVFVTAQLNDAAQRRERLEHSNVDMDSDMSFENSHDFPGTPLIPGVLSHHCTDPPHTPSSPSSPLPISKLSLALRTASRGSHHVAHTPLSALSIDASTTAHVVANSAVCATIPATPMSTRDALAGASVVGAARARTRAKKQAFVHPHGHREAGIPHEVVEAVAGAPLMRRTVPSRPWEALLRREAQLAGASSDASTEAHASSAVGEGVARNSVSAGCVARVHRSRRRAANALPTTASTAQVISPSSSVVDSSGAAQHTCTELHSDSQTAAEVALPSLLVPAQRPLPLLYPLVSARWLHVLAPTIRSAALALQTGISHMLALARISARKEAASSASSRAHMSAHGGLSTEVNAWNRMLRCLPPRVGFALATVLARSHSQSLGATGVSISPRGTLTSPSIALAVDLPTVEAAVTVGALCRVARLVSMAVRGMGKAAAAALLRIGTDGDSGDAGVAAWREVALLVERVGSTAVEGEVRAWAANMVQRLHGLVTAAGAHARVDEDEVSDAEDDSAEATESPQRLTDTANDAHTSPKNAKVVRGDVVVEAAAGVHSSVQQAEAESICATSTKNSSATLDGVKAIRDACSPAVYALADEAASGGVMGVALPSPSVSVDAGSTAATADGAVIARTDAAPLGETAEAQAFDAGVNCDISTDTGTHLSLEDKTNPAFSAAASTVHGDPSPTEIADKGSMDLVLRVRDDGAVFVHVDVGESAPDAEAEVGERVLRDLMNEEVRHVLTRPVDRDCGADSETDTAIVVATDVIDANTDVAAISFDTPRGGASSPPRVPTRVLRVRHVTGRALLGGIDLPRQALLEAPTVQIIQAGEDQTVARLATDRCPRSGRRMDSLPAPLAPTLATSYSSSRIDPAHVPLPSYPPARSSALSTTLRTHMSATVPHPLHGRELSVNVDPSSGRVHRLPVDYAAHDKQREATLMEAQLVALNDSVGGASRNIGDASGEPVLIMGLAEQRRRQVQQGPADASSAPVEAAEPAHLYSALSPRVHHGSLPRTLSVAQLATRATPATPSGHSSDLTQSAPRSLDPHTRAQMVVDALRTQQRTRLPALMATVATLHDGSVPAAVARASMHAAGSATFTSSRGAAVDVLLDGRGRTYAAVHVQQPLAGSRDTSSSGSIVAHQGTAITRAQVGVEGVGSTEALSTIVDSDSAAATLPGPLSLVHTQSPAHNRRIARSPSPARSALSPARAAASPTRADAAMPAAPEKSPALAGILPLSHMARFAPLARPEDTVDNADIAHTAAPTGPSVTRPISRAAPVGDTDADAVPSMTLLYRAHSILSRPPSAFQPLSHGYLVDYPDPLLYADDTDLLHTVPPAVALRSLRGHGNVIHGHENAGGSVPVDASASQQSPSSATTDTVSSTFAAVGNGACSGVANAAHLTFPGHSAAPTRTPSPAGGSSLLNAEPAPVPMRPRGGLNLLRASLAHDAGCVSGDGDPTHAHGATGVRVIRDDYAILDVPSHAPEGMPGLAVSTADTLELYGGAPRSILEAEAASATREPDFEQRERQDRARALLRAAPVDRELAQAVAVVVGDRVKPDLGTVRHVLRRGVPVSAAKYAHLALTALKETNTVTPGLSDTQPTPSAAKATDAQTHALVPVSAYGAAQPHKVWLRNDVTAVENATLSNSHVAATMALPLYHRVRAINGLLHNRLLCATRVRNTAETLLADTMLKGHAAYSSVVAQEMLAKQRIESLLAGTHGATDMPHAPALLPGDVTGADGDSSSQLSLATRDAHRGSASCGTPANAGAMTVYHPSTATVAAAPASVLTPRIPAEHVLDATMTSALAAALHADAANAPSRVYPRKRGLDYITSYHNRVPARTDQTFIRIPLHLYENQLVIEPDPRTNQLVAHPPLPLPPPKGLLREGKPHPRPAQRGAALATVDMAQRTAALLGPAGDTLEREVAHMQTSMSSSLQHATSTALVGASSLRYLVLASPSSPTRLATPFSSSSTSVRHRRAPVLINLAYSRLIPTGGVLRSLPEVKRAQRERAYRERQIAGAVAVALSHADELTDPPLHSGVSASDSNAALAVAATHCDTHEDATHQRRPCACGRGMADECPCAHAPTFVTTANPRPVAGSTNTTEGVGSPQRDALHPHQRIPPRNTYHPVPKPKLRVSTLDSAALDENSFEHALELQRRREEAETHRQQVEHELAESVKPVFHEREYSHKPYRRDPLDKLVTSQINKSTRNLARAVQAVAKAQLGQQRDRVSGTVVSRREVHNMLSSSRALQPAVRVNTPMEGELCTPRRDERAAATVTQPLPLLPAVARIRTISSTKAATNATSGVLPAFPTRGSRCVVSSSGLTPPRTAAQPALSATATARVTTRLPLAQTRKGAPVSARPPTLHFELMRVPDRIDHMRHNASFIREAAARALQNVDMLTRQSDSDVALLHAGHAGLLAHTQPGPTEPASARIDASGGEERMYVTMADVKHIVAVNGYDKL